MSRFASKLSARRPLVLSVLRVVMGLLFLEHGTMKMFSFPGSDHAGPALFSIFGLAGVIELVGGAFLVLGLFTRFAAFIMSGEMAFAYFMAHYPHSFYPIVNQGEAAVMFCFVFLYFVFAGAGPLSLDARAGRA